MAVILGQVNTSGMHIAATVVRPKIIKKKVCFGLPDLAKFFVPGPFFLACGMFLTK